jgi:hypothetical protein
MPVKYGRLTPKECLWRKSFNAKSVSRQLLGRPGTFSYVLSRASNFKDRCKHTDFHTFAVTCLCARVGRISSTDKCFCPVQTSQKQQNFQIRPRLSAATVIGSFLITFISTTRWFQLSHLWAHHLLTMETGSTESAEERSTVDNGWNQTGLDCCRVHLVLL